MDGKEMMKDLYKYFGEKKEENQEMYSIANVFYEMGTKEESNETTIDKEENQYTSYLVSAIYRMKWERT